MGEKILIVEDDFDFANVMRDFLVADGYEVREAHDGTTALQISESLIPDLILLDLMIPNIDGVEVCRKIRESSHAPIIIISAKKSDYDKIIALGVGADDYLTKPFSLVEMVARVKSHLRRYTTFSGEKKKESKRVYGSLAIDPDSYKVSMEGMEIPFTSKEFKIIDCLSAHPGMVYTKEKLMNLVWGYNEYIDENTIAVYIGRIREKLNKHNINAIKTVWGVGYKWEL